MVDDMGLYLEIISLLCWADVNSMKISPAKCLTCDQKVMGLVPNNGQIFLSSVNSLC